MSILKDLKTPVFYAEPVPKGVTRENYRLEVTGLLKVPMFFTFKQIEDMPFTSVNARLTSVSGWTVRAIWQGVKFTDFLKRIELKPRAGYVDFASFGGYTTCLPIEELQKERVLLCYKVNDEYLETMYGAPLRMFIPHLWGYKSIKGLAKITFTDNYKKGYWESRGYSDKATITTRMILDVNTQTKKQIHGGEVTEF